MMMSHSCTMTETPFVAMLTCTPTQPHTMILYISQSHFSESRIIYFLKKQIFLFPTKIKIMCCRNGLMSRISSSPLPVIYPRTQFQIPPLIRLPVSTGAPKSFRKMSAVRDGGSAVTETTVIDDLSFYELLGIPETVSSLEIKQAYKQLARKYHPDVSPPDRVEEYTQRFIRVQEAYETLSDPNRRSLYDRDMAMGIHFGFSSRNNHEQMEKSEWRGQWQCQLSELRKRSMYKESGKNASWAARMRSQRTESTL